MFKSKVNYTFDEAVKTSWMYDEELWLGIESVLLFFLFDFFNVLFCFLHQKYM